MINRIICLICQKISYTYRKCLKKIKEGLLILCGPYNCPVTL